MHAFIHTYTQAFKLSHHVIHRQWEAPTLAWANESLQGLGHFLRPAVQPSSSLTIQLFILRVIESLSHPAMQK